jgi:ATP phosphoribosyltransferase regulatory subunit
MIGVRADMTPQIARIAGSRLGQAARPLRLSYAGQVLRVRSSGIRPERQFSQVGAELIGAAGPAADVEAIAVAGEALSALGVRRLSVDITLPTLVPAVAEAFGIDGERRAALRVALDRKDAAAVGVVGGAAGELFGRLLAAAGPSEVALAALDRLALPAGAWAERVRLGAVLDGLAEAAPELAVTVDPVENRGFEYHTGISFTLFAADLSGNGPIGELGRGGRYHAGDHDAPEPATGFSLYAEAILRTLPRPAAPPRLLLPPGADRSRARALRQDGWITVAALEPAGDWQVEARRLGCSHVLEAGAPVALD